MPRLISRDPFARTELFAWVVPASMRKISCDWCGNTERKLFSYTVEHDDGRRASDIKGQFCCVDCMRAYHNIDE